MKHFFIRLFYILLFLSNACTGLEEVPSVHSVTLTTGPIDLESLVVTGEIKTLGDGITNHGHVWSSTNNPPTIADNTTDLGAKLQPGSYSSSLNLFEAASTYVRGYAKDVYGRYFYGEVTTVGKANADFEVVNDNCPARCTITFNNLSSKNATTFTWNFGDGSEEEHNSNSTHEYTSPGTYNVRLIASGAGVLADTAVKSVTVSKVTFEKVYPGLGPARRIVQLPSEDYIIAGTTAGQGIYLAFIDKQGVLTGTKPLTSSASDEIGNMIVLSSGALAIVGTTADESTESTDILYIKTDQEGTPIGEPKRIAVTSGNDLGSDVLELVDCGNVECGIMILGQVINPNTQKGSVHLIKTNTDADVTAFSKSIPGTESQNGFDIMAMGDNFFIAGVSGTNATLWKLNSNGDIISGFPKVFDNDANNVAHSIVRTSSGELMMGGVISTGGSATANIYLIKTDLNGVPIFPFPLSVGSTTEGESGNALVAGSDNSILIAGKKSVNAYFIKVNSAGQKLWEGESGGRQNDYFSSALSTIDGGYIFAGSWDNSLYLVKTDSLGQKN